MNRTQNNDNKDSEGLLQALSDEELGKLLNEQTKERTGLTPRQFQLDAAIALVRNQDLIVKAGTGSGKTLSFVMPCFVSRKTTVIIVSPLNALQEDQVCMSFHMVIFQSI
jgi:ATP-dependent helicase YprA (DUF1998 family)